MRVFKFVLDEERKCPECNYETSVAFVIARTEEEAKELSRKHEFLCGNCLADKIADENYVVAKEFDPDDYPDIAFPNWLRKVGRVRTGG